jgi:hypothetical protein
MDALTRLHRSLVGGDDEDQPEDSILADTEDLCSLSPLQVKQYPPSETSECSKDFMALVCIDLILYWPFACSEDLRLRGMFGGRTHPHDLGTLSQTVARIV